MAKYLDFVQERYKGSDGSGEMFVHQTSSEDIRSVVPDGYDPDVFVERFEVLKQRTTKSIVTKREDMPVIKEQDIAEFVAFLKAKGFETKLKKLPASVLFPSQKQIHFDKILSNIEYGTDKIVEENTVIVSKKNFLTDGHHKWATTMMTDPTRELNVLHVKLDIGRLLKEAKLFSDLIGNNSRK